LAALTEYVRASGTTQPLRFTAALANGRDLYAFRYAYNGKANTLYYRQAGDNVVIASEPLDKGEDVWKPVPPGQMVIARAHDRVRLQPFREKMKLAG
ncbi:MAG TPA: class II glutamine amidotransferase, partial [Xanthobacteraceae bacterium]|nr:class II glutamine amidotransferase [Xanthobacteraceae bacterium]